MNSSSDHFASEGWKAYVMYVNGILAYIVNSILVYFVLRYSRKEMGTYKFLILLFAIFDMVYVTCHMIVLPKMHVHRHAFIMFPTGMLMNEMEAGHWGIVIYVSTFCLATILLGYHFVYRYLLVCQNHLMYIFNSIKYVPVLFSVWFMGGILWGTMAHTTFDVKEYSRTAIMEAYEIDVDKVPMTGPIWFHDDPSGGLSVFHPGFFGATVCMMLLSSSFTAIIFCTIKILSTLKRSTMSAKGKKLQYDMLKALLIQAFVPLVCEYIPCAVTFFCPFAGIPLGKYTNLVPIAISFYPVLDPICIMYFVKDYRYAIIRIFRPSSSVNPYTASSKENEPSKSKRTTIASIQQPTD